MVLLFCVGRFEGLSPGYRSANSDLFPPRRGGVVVADKETQHEIKVHPADTFKAS